MIKYRHLIDIKWSSFVLEYYLIAMLESNVLAGHVPDERPAFLMLI